jgi:hypothetical protein
MCELRHTSAEFFAGWLLLKIDTMPLHSFETSV